jgi:hypothetical protein
MTGHEVYLRSQTELECVPDGTIITWRRIPADRTSEAVAFVRVQVEYPGIREDEAAGIREQPERVIWISPGGWDPHTIEDAGVTYPCEVIRWGEVGVVPPVPPGMIPSIPPMPTLSPLPFVPPLDRMSREVALDAAARVWAGNAVNSAHWIQSGAVIETARDFETWLNREDETL